MDVLKFSPVPGSSEVGEENRPFKYKKIRIFFLIGNFYNLTKITSPLT